MMRVNALAPDTCELMATFETEAMRRFGMIAARACRDEAIGADPRCRVQATTGNPRHDMAYSNRITSLALAGSLIACFALAPSVGHAQRAPGPVKAKACKVSIKGEWTCRRQEKAARAWAVKSKGEA